MERHLCAVRPGEGKSTGLGCTLEKATRFEFQEEAKGANGLEARVQSDGQQEMTTWRKELAILVYRNKEN